VRFARRAQSSAWLMADAEALVGDSEEFSAVQVAERPATCGWAAGSVVGVHHSAGAGARFSGLQQCASVWSCPCCGSYIRSRRSDEVMQANEWWEGKGGVFLFLTLTVRHRAGDSLARTMDAVTGGYTGLINGAPWKRFARRHGIRHFIKSQEVTLGWENGWHAHLHVLLFVDLAGAAADLAEDARAAWAEAAAWAGTPGAGAKRRAARNRQADAEEAARIAAQGIGKDRERELWAWLTERWRVMVVRAGGRPPSQRRGVVIRTARDGRVVGLYIAKLQEGDRAGWSIGKEMTRQDMKRGRADSLVPLELLDLDGLTAEEVERNRAYWLEYVHTTKGRRAMTWSRGLKLAAGITDLDDEELLAEAAEEVEEDDLVLTITGSDFARIRHDPDLLALVLELVEAGDLDRILSIVPFQRPQHSPPK